jgi:hypothetical protein
MALTPEVRTTQTAIRGLAETDNELNVSQAAARVVFNIPTDFVRVTQTAVRNVTVDDVRLRVTQAVIRVIARAATQDPQARSWKFVQDGHEFYVLNLGEEGTLTYDRATQQWHSWNSPNITRWRPRCGLNWRSRAYAGDRSFGLIYEINPTQGTDESAREAGVFLPFTRQVTGIIPLRGRTRARLNGVRLTINNGDPVLGLAAITLHYSDDQGKTFQSAGTINVAPNDTRQEFLWRSLGTMRPPGRMFLFEDQGATIRIDGADIDFTGSDE